jgi:hypothetical protein
MAAKPVLMKDAILAGKDFFRSLDREGFVQWLWAGISTLYTKKTYAGFAPVDGFIGFGETAIDDLETIYRELVPAGQQLLFRQAIGDILDAHKDDEGDVSFEEIRDLMYLAHRVDAVEVVKVIAHAVGYGLAAKKSKQLFYYAISNLKSFDPSSDLCEAMLELVDSPDFNNRFIFDVANFLSQKGFVLAGEEAIPKLTAHMDALYREAQALSEKAVVDVEQEAAKISWYRVPEE